MDTRKYRIGIEINTRYINAVLVFQQDKQWEIDAYWQFPLPFDKNIEYLKLRNILKPWREKLPHRCHAVISLPSICESYHILPSPSHISLTPAACYRLAQLHATSYTQTTQTAVNVDYRQNLHNIAIHLCHQQPLERYLALFTQLNLTVDAVDIPACALRYLASYLDISPDSSIVYCEDKTMHWVAPDKNMPHYGAANYSNIQEQTHLFQQLIKKHQWSSDACYFSGENHHQIETALIWPQWSHRLFQPFSAESYLYDLPLIALGLALRPMEAKCIK